jgi:hypothetical protein
VCPADHPEDCPPGVESSHRRGRRRWVIERSSAWLFAVFLTPAATLTCYKKLTTWDKL